MDSIKSVPVVIIGGGPVSLSASILLSMRGVCHTLYERHSGTAIHPKACGINQRTMEIFRVMGIENEVYSVGAPDAIATRLAWYTNLGPNGKEIYSRDGWGRGQYFKEYATHSPTQFTMLPQIRLEPILLRRALELNADGIKHNTEVVSVEDKNDGTVSLKIRSVKGGKEEHVAAHYVICCDGGKAFTEKTVNWTGQKDVFDMVTAHFQAPLRNRHPDARNFITWFTDARTEGSVKSGAIYQIGPWPLKDDVEEWIFLCNLSSNDPEEFTDESMRARIQDALQIDDIPIDIISLSHWNVNAINAAHYRAGRIFFAGDAGHRIPPWGALGMNTGIQDVQNLVWKLTMALSDEFKYDGLLTSYDNERRPIGQRVGHSSLNNLLMHRSVIDAALGVSDSHSMEENQQNMAEFFAEMPGSQPKHDAIKRAAHILDTEFKAAGNEVGWFYPCADINNEGGKTHGGQLKEDGSFDQTTYHPSTIPGHQLPHSWIQKEGKTIAIRDLIPFQKMVLLVQSPGWESLDGDMVTVELIGEGGYKDIGSGWAKNCQVSGNGGVLVRPDGIVAWRGEKSDALLRMWPKLLERVLYLSN